MGLRDLTKQPISRQTYWRGVAPKLCSLAPGWLDFWDTIVEFNINNEFIIYIACSPQGDCILLFRDPSVTFRPSPESEFVSVLCNTGGEVSLQAES